MAKRVQDKKPGRTKAAQAWMKENIEEQKVRWQAIFDRQESMWPQRRKWYAEFLKVIQTRGFNSDGDTLQKIPKSQVPKEPKRKHRVVY